MKVEIKCESVRRLLSTRVALIFLITIPYIKDGIRIWVHMQLKFLSVCSHAATLYNPDLVQEIKAISFRLLKVITIPLSLQVQPSLPDRPCAPPADFTTRRPPLSAPERWHWPRLSLWQPAHVHSRPLRVRQRRHSSADQPGAAALCHHTCSGHNGRPLWAGCHRFVWRQGSILTLHW